MPYTVILLNAYPGRATVKEMESLLELYTCVVCRDICKVPVLLTCFKSQGHHCQDFRRLCLRCARNYFGLNKRQTDRTTVRCPFCNSPGTSINMREQNANAYSIDHVSMATITALIKSKNFDELECDCGSKFWDQDILYKHIQNTCPESLYRCECGRFLYRKEKREHDENCPYMVITCPFCNTKMKRDAESTRHVAECRDNSKNRIEELKKIIESSNIELDVLAQKMKEFYSLRTRNMI